ncbi:putative membrane protein [metagenome]|uniref:Putative membrane protein n=1 Tax=metagenome TaxID=256318 RepID=A0A2P2C154_9ZZZZ
MPSSLAHSRAGLGIAVVVVSAAMLAPGLLGWEVHTHSHAVDPVPPLHATWDPKVGPGTLPAVLLALASWRWAVDLAERLPWRRLLLASWVVGLAWMLALALVDGPDGISRALGNSYEYLPTARATADIPAMLDEFVSRIPLAAPDNWVTHVAGHPPGALLFFVVLDQLGLGGDLAAGLVVTLIGASTSAAVLVTVRVLGAETMARRAAPFLVLGPAAIWMAVSADAVFAATAAWGLAALAGAAARRSRPLAVLAGVLLGGCVLLSYGLPLLGVLAVTILLLARTWRPLPIAAAAALVVVLALVPFGFRLWEAFPVLRERYWDGIASDRPAAYWIWANLAVLILSSGPMLAAGWGRLTTRDAWTPPRRIVAALSAAATASILLADLSQLSKAEVERIWLPFVPWILLSVALLPERWRRVGLAVQLVVALVLQHLLYTSW